MGSTFHSASSQIEAKLHSAFVGVAVLVLSLPVPAYLGKLRHSVQQKQMKSVCAPRCVPPRAHAIVYSPMRGWKP
jgi:hypothetical protein